MEGWLRKAQLAQWLIECLRRKPQVFVQLVGVSSHGQIRLDDFCVKYVFLESRDSPKPLDSVTQTWVILMVFGAPDVEKT